MDQNQPTDDQQKKAEELAAKALEKVFARIVPVLTKDDMESIAALEEKDDSGEAVKYFIMSKVPNFQALIEEEVAAALKEDSETTSSSE